MLRIIAMYMVVVIHVLGMGGVYGEECSIASTFLNTFLYAMVFCCVNCYALISGYVGYREKSKQNFSSYLNLWFQVVFYGILVLLIMKISGIAQISMIDFAEAIMPVTRNQYWYFTAYTGVFLVSPIINKIIEVTEERVMKQWCIIGIVVFSFYTTIAQNIGVNGDPFGINEGYSFLWLAFLYFLGAAIKKYKWNYKILHIKRARIKLVVVGIACVITTASWFLIISNFMPLILNMTWGEKMLMNYVSPTVLCLGIIFLILFSELDLNKKVVSFIRWCSPATFGVFLLHTQHKVIEHVFSGGMFKWIANYQGLFPTIVVLGISLIIFGIGILVDRCRIRIFKFCKLKIITDKVNKIIWSCLDRMTS